MFAMADKVSSSRNFHDNLSQYASCLPPDAKNRYMDKLLYNRGTSFLPDPYAIAGKWDPSPSSWPDLTFGDIYLYLIDTPSIYTKESMKAYKSLDAYTYVVSGHVQEVVSHAIDDTCPFIALKTKVTPSQRARDKPHEPWVYLEKSSGTVYCAHCTCMAGLGEVCSHVGALLFKVEMGVKMGFTVKSSTSQACQWNNSFRKEVTPTTVTDIFKEIKGKRTKDVHSVQANGSAPLPPQEVLDQLYAIVPDAAFFSSVKINNNSIPIASNEKYPELLSSFHQDYAADDIDIFSSYEVTQEQAENLEKATRGQSVSSLWFQHRMGRVTGSKAHDVLVRRETTSPENLVRRIAGYTNHDLSGMEAVKWGVDQEDKCRHAYTRHQKSTHDSFVCKLAGFVINPAKPFLGASPDGLVTCKCCGKGTLEIKCPFKHRNVSVQEAAATDQNFCLTPDLTLKKTHKYYTQTQMQMLVTETLYSDFVIYTKASMVIVRIPFDPIFCEMLEQKCNKFIKMYVIPELLTRHLENEPVSRPAANPEADSMWCICNEGEYGRMIQCDGDDCPHQWFHYRCVNIRRKPRGRWFCAGCQP